MRVLGDFRLKTLVDRISEELQQLKEHSRNTFKTEYQLKKPVIQQEERKVQDRESDLPNI